MKPALLDKLGYFGWLGAGGLPSPPPEADDKHGVRALPSNWYTSKQMYELERRAIFSKKWQLITHKVRLSQPGDWLRFDIAGFQILLCKDRQGDIHGFHNICRHRAYPVVEGDQGTAKIFACKYHGWSYGLNGKLAKAPQYQDLSGFEKDKNGLLPIHVHMDCNGFIWVNLDGGKEPEIAWEDDFAGIDRQERYHQFNFEDYVFDHTWQMEGDYNWKILSDNYNECYHCATTHPDIGLVADLQSYSVDTKNGQIIHNPATTPEMERDGMTVASTYYFPNVSTNITKPFFMIQRFVPSSPTKSTMSYQVFRNRHATDEAFETLNQIYKRIMSEDKALCDQAQKNLNAGVFINGEMHPRLEKGPLHFQSVVREIVMAHAKRERAAGEEIYPARQRLPESAGVSRADIEFCNGLACGEEREELKW